jgi:hypothetical protein
LNNGAAEFGKVLGFDLTIKGDEQGFGFFHR